MMSNPATPLPKSQHCGAASARTASSAQSSSHDGFASPGGLAPAVLLSDGQKNVTALQFWCKRCDRAVALAEMSIQKEVCRKDAASYKAMAARWQTSRKLKVMWETHTPSQRIEWYRKQQNAESGSKRKFDEVTYAEQSVKTEALDEEELDHFIPWSIFKESDKKKSEATLLQDFTDIVHRSDTEAIWRRDQWLVPRFEGVMRKKRKTMAQEQVVRRSAGVTSNDQLDKLMVGGKVVLDQFRNSIAPTAMALATDTPYVDVRPEDQPAAVEPIDAMSSAVSREVKRCNDSMD